MGHSQQQLELAAHRRRCAALLAETTDGKVVELVGWIASAPRSVPELLRLWRSNRTTVPAPGPVSLRKGGRRPV